MFAELVCGYKKVELENLNGLETFNGEFNFTPPIKSITTKLDIRCKWITNDFAIEQTRRIQFQTTSTTDNNRDEDIFLIHAKPIAGSDELEAVRNEGYTSVTGIDTPETVYNLQLSPGQNLRRWGRYIRGTMTRGGIIKYSSATKNTNLVTVKDGVTIVENADIDVSTLDYPIVLPEQFELAEFPLTRAQWDLIEANPSGICEFENKGVKCN
jgi:hypothetical protein